MVTQLALLDPQAFTPTYPAVPPAAPTPPARPTPAAPRRPERVDPPRSSRPDLRSGPAATPRSATPAAAGDEGWWRLDERTRALGHRGVEEARRALAAAVERVGAAA